MPFTLIKGTFRVVGLSPDGDSIRFVPDDDALVSALPGGSAGSKPSRQLRLEGIDALETHYNARHQPSRWAFAATEAILAFAGVRNVQWDSRHATIVAADDETRGWILARHKEKYNRPVAFLFAGETPDGDGTSVTFDEDLLRRSFNLQALQEGLAYPTFYASLFADLRAAMTAAAVDARTAERGLWQDDRTTAGFEATSLGVLMDEVPILPKLFRRLSDYMAATGTAVGFKEALAQGQDLVWDLRTQQRTHLDTFVEQASGSAHIRLTRIRRNSCSTRCRSSRRGSSPRSSVRRCRRAPEAPLTDHARARHDARLAYCVASEAGEPIAGFGKGSCAAP